MTARGKDPEIRGADEPLKADHHGVLLDQVMRALAAAGPTATGATLLTPDGSTRYISIAQARAWVTAHPLGRPS